VFDADLIAFLESGCGTIVGLVTPSGAPFATRGWGLRVEGGDPPRLRLLLGAAAFAASGRDGAERFAVAITGGDVRTLRSAQVKGDGHGVEPATEDDLATCRRYVDEFFAAVHETDGSDLDLLARMTPLDLVACTVDVRQVFDQSPGPGAGRLVAGS
jgi:hypothetical protein